MTEILRKYKGVEIALSNAKYKVFTSFETNMQQGKTMLKPLDELMHRLVYLHLHPSAEAVPIMVTPRQESCQWRRRRGIALRTREGHGAGGGDGDFDKNMEMTSLPSSSLEYIWFLLAAILGELRLLGGTL